MGQKQSAPGVTATGNAAPEAAKPKATALVVGAGITGVHVAYELAVNGFDVTVMEKDASIGLPSSALANEPGLVYWPWRPRFWNIQMKFEFPFSFLPMSGHQVISSETPKLKLIAVDFWTWMFRRATMSSFHINHITRAGTFLMSESERVMSDLRDVHPELARIPYNTNGVAFRTPSGAWQGASTELAYSFDTVSWTQALANICEKQLGVKFQFGRQLISLNWAMENDVEWIHSVVSQATEDVRNLAEETEAYVDDYDVVVITTGSGAHELVFNSRPCPILPVASYALEVTPKDESHIEPYTESKSFAFGFLSNALYVFRKSTDRLGVCGLLSLLPSFTGEPDTYDEAYIYNKMQRRLKVYSDININEELSKDHEVTTHRFIRGFTPDGLPIVSRFGGLFNLFMCAGHGFDAGGWGPGSAKLVTRQVLRKLDERDYNPFSYLRFFPREDVPRYVLDASERVRRPTLMTPNPIHQDRIVSRSTKVDGLEVVTEKGMLRVYDLLRRMYYGRISEGDNDWESSLGHRSKVKAEKQALEEALLRVRSQSMEELSRIKDVR